MARERITITIPRDVLAAADRRANELDRSRSWVLTDAVRCYLRTTARARHSAVAEAPARYSAASPAGLGAYRLAQLEADLALTPTERVLRAEQTARAVAVRERKPIRSRVVTFDRYEDFLEWKRGEDLAVR